MNIVALVPTLNRASKAASLWGPFLEREDRLFPIVCSSPPGWKGQGHDALPLELDVAPFARWESVARVLLSHPRMLWDSIWKWGVYLGTLPLITTPIVDAIRSCDPDVVDLREMRGSLALKQRLVAEGLRGVYAEGDSVELKGLDGSWRRYDPDAKVSIVLPVHNGAHYLAEALESCLRQSHRNLEVIIVDDGSTDETPAIAAKYARADSRVLSLRNARNLHLPAALNVGFRHATGDLLTWTSHDNYYAPRAIEVLVRYLNTWPDIGLVYSEFHRIDAEGRVKPDVFCRPPPHAIEKLNPVGPFFLYRRSVYEAIGEYRTDMELVEDYDYWLRVSARFKIMRIHEPLYYFREHPESLTAKIDGSTQAAMRDKIRRAHFVRSRR